MLSCTSKCQNIDGVFHVQFLKNPNAVIFNNNTSKFFFNTIDIFELIRIGLGGVRTWDNWYSSPLYNLNCKKWRLYAKTICLAFSCQSKNTGVKAFIKLTPGMFKLKQQFWSAKTSFNGF